ncbi:MAG TPA: response regulator [Candidatus Saccharimonadales bacterium]|nr:response regulator [Candidatus Saccharimonadales bacterium]
MQNVLVIEPDTALARTYVQALRHAGYAVRHATGAQDAIDAADQSTPAAVVMEIQLAVHDGVEFLHEFRSHAEWRFVPVVVNTNLTPVAIRPVQAALAADLGVMEVLYKPQTSLQQVISAVRRVLT